MGKGIEHQVSHCTTENIERIYLFQEENGELYVCCGQPRLGWP